MRLTGLLERLRREEREKESQSNSTQEQEIKPFPAQPQPTTALNTETPKKKNKKKRKRQKNVDTTEEDLETLLQQKKQKILDSLTAAQTLEPHVQTTSVPVIGEWSCSVPVVGYWSWRDEKHQWTLYDKEISDRIEKNFVGKMNEVKIDEERYIDLKDLLERRYDDEKKKRYICRKIPPKTSEIETNTTQEKEILSTQELQECHFTSQTSFIRSHIFTEESISEKEITPINENTKEIESTISTVESIIEKNETSQTETLWVSQVESTIHIQESGQYVTELVKLSSVTDSESFLKGGKWSPDGNYFLTNSEDHTIRIYSLPDYSQPRETTTNITSISAYPEGEDIHDFCWYPHMKSDDPSTAVFLTTSRDHPIHLWDAFSGKSRASYTAYDQMDEPMSAISVAFNATGEKIIGGYNKALCVWDITSPGRKYQPFSTVMKNSNKPQTRQFSSDLDLNGVISAIAVNPDYSGLIACGSFNTGIGIYIEKEMEPFAVLWGHEGGITHLKWSPCGHYLYSGARKDNFIRCWDIRNTMEVLFKIPRTCTTNQKMFFDVDSSGRFLCTGDQKGSISTYDLFHNGKLAWQLENAHKDSVNSVSFHPNFPVLLSTSGQRKFSLSTENESSDSELIDNSITIWQISQTTSP